MLPESMDICAIIEQSLSTCRLRFALQVMHLIDLQTSLSAWSIYPYYLINRMRDSLHKQLRPIQIVVGWWVASWAWVFHTARALTLQQIQDFLVVTSRSIRPGRLAVLCTDVNKAVNIEYIRATNMFWGGCGRFGFVFLTHIDWSWQEWGITITYEREQEKAIQLKGMNAVFQ